MFQGLLGVFKMSGVFVGLALLASSCASGPGGGLSTGGAASGGGAGPLAGAGLAEGPSPGAGPAASLAAAEGAVSLVLLGAGVDSLTVGWGGGFASGAAALRLRWRDRPHEEPVDDAGGGVWESVDLPASARSYKITGLEPGGRYAVRLSALDAGGRETAALRGGFGTQAPPPGNLTATPLAHDAVTLRWSPPAGWSPTGYVIRWRPRGGADFAGRLNTPPGRTKQVIDGLTGGTRYVFRITALTPARRETPARSAGARTPPARAGGLTLKVDAPAECVTGEGSTLSMVDRQLLYEQAERLWPEGSEGPTTEEWNTLMNSEAVRRNTRQGVASITVSWEISGGTAPYQISGAGVEGGGASGSAEVTCAREGVNLDDLDDAEAGVVDAGPKTFTLTAADAAGASATATVTVEIIKLAEPGAVIASGSTHRSGLQYAQVPEGMEIVFEGLVNATYPLAEPGDAPLPPSTRFRYRQVTPGPRATEVQVNTITGEEIVRYVVMLTTRHGIATWDRQPNMQLTPEENTLWNQYFNSLNVLPPSSSELLRRIPEIVGDMIDYNNKHLPGWEMSEKFRTALEKLEELGYDIPNWEPPPLQNEGGGVSGAPTPLRPNQNKQQQPPRTHPPAPPSHTNADPPQRTPQ